MSDNLRGIGAMLISATGTVVNDALVKVATAELPNGQLIFIRGLMATTLIGLAAWYFGAMRPVSVLLQRAMIIRILGAGLATVFIVGALRHLPLAVVSTVLQVTPLMVTAGSALLLRAHVGWRRWLASLIGLSGVLLILRPGAEGFSIHVWLALAALLFTTTRDLTTRFIDHTIPSLYVTFASSAMITLAGLSIASTETWVMPTWQVLVLLGGASAAVFLGYYLGVVAMRTGEIAVVAPFRYWMIPMALGLSYAIWGYIPDVTSLVGIAIVCLAGLYLLSRERPALSSAQPIQSTSTAVGRMP